MTGLLLFGVLLGIALLAMSIPPERLGRDLNATDGLRPDRSPEQASSTRPWRLRLQPLQRVGVRRAIVLSAIIVAGVGAYFVLRPQNAPGGSAPRLAVLPFAAIGPSDESLAIGMTEELTTRLGKLSGLSLASLSAMRSLGASASPQDIASALGTDYLLEGSISAEGRDADRRIRVRARLVDSRGATQVWSEVYDESAEQLFDVQGRIAVQVANAMSVNLLADERATLAQAPTDNFDAYERYLVAIRYRRRVLDPDAALRARDAFRAATELDPDFAGAWAGLASSYLWLAIQHARGGQLDSARAALLRAESLDRDDPDVRLARALMTSRVDLDVDQARAQYETLRTVVYDHQKAVVNTFIGNIDWRRGRFRDALETGVLVEAGDPFLAVLNIGYAEFYLHLGRYEQAAALINRSIAAGAQNTMSLRFAALLPVLERGDTAAAWEALSTADATQLRTVLLDGLHSDSRALLRLFAPRLSDAHLGATPVARAGPFAAGAELARAVFAMQRGRVAEGQAHYEAAATQLEAIVRDEAEFVPAVRVTVRCALAIALAGAGRHQDAADLLGETEKALPDPEDRLMQLEVLMARAEVRALAGNTNGARDDVVALLSQPSPISARLIDVDPLWSDLRGDPELTAIRRRT